MRKIWNFSDYVSTDVLVIVVGDFVGTMTEKTVIRLNIFLSQNLFALPKITEISVYINRPTGPEAEVQTQMSPVSFNAQRIPVKFIDFIYWCR